MPIFKGKCTNLRWCQGAQDDLELEVEAPNAAAAVCPKCGQRLETAGAVIAPLAASPPWHRRPALRSGAAALMLAMAAGGLASSKRIRSLWPPQPVRTDTTQVAAQDSAANPPKDSVNEPRDSTAAARPDNTKDPSYVPPGITLGDTPKSHVAVLPSQEHEHRQADLPTRQEVVPAQGFVRGSIGPASGAPAAVTAQVVQTPQPPPPPPAHAVAVLARNTVLLVKPARNYCASELRRGTPMEFVLADAVALPSGGSVPQGASLTGRVVAREVGSGADDPDRLRIELTTLQAGGGNVGLSTGAVAIDLRRQSSTGTVLRYGLLGAAAGATVAVLLRKDVRAGAAIGAGSGAAVGRLRAGAADPCFIADQTSVPFHLVADALVPSS